MTGQTIHLLTFFFFNFLDCNIHSHLNCYNETLLQLPLTSIQSCFVLMDALIEGHDLFAFWRCGPMRAMASSFLRFLHHTQWCTTVGRTLLDEWSACRRDLYLTTHNTHNRQTSMHPRGIRTHDLSRQAAADLPLRPHGHWDRLTTTFGLVNTQTYKLKYRTECHWQAMLWQGNVIKNSIMMLAYVLKGQENFTDIKMWADQNIQLCGPCVWLACSLYRDFPPEWCVKPGEW